MLKIRLQRTGRRNHAEFRVVVTESTRGPKSGNFLEVLGAYNPHRNEVTLNGERIKYWQGMGAQVSDTVHNLLVGDGVIEGKKRNVLPKKSPITKEGDESATEAAPAAESSDESADAPAEEAKEEEPVAA